LSKSQAAFSAKFSDGGDEGLDPTNFEAHTDYAGDGRPFMMDLGGEDADDVMRTNTISSLGQGSSGSAGTATGSGGGG